MPDLSYTSLNGVSQYGETLLASHLEQNLKVFFDWGLLNVGAWTNITRPNTAAYGGSFSTLRRVDDPSYSQGQIWETARKDWVFETGLAYTGGIPIGLSGIFVNSIFYGTGDATFGHHYNYPLGRVVFDAPISTSSTIELSHSFRNVQVYRADEAPWWTELQYNSLRPDDSHYDLTGSGDWSILATHRVQLPAIILEIVPRRNFQPYELGNLSQWVNQDMLFHILAESRWARNQLIDIISFQNDKTIWLFDSNLIALSGAYPLDFRGMLLPGGLMYPELVSPPYQWKRCRFENTTVSEVRTMNPRLHEGTVRTTLKVLWSDNH
jgi:hypothetical protein